MNEVDRSDVLRPADVEVGVMAVEETKDHAADDGETVRLEAAGARSSKESALGESKSETVVKSGPEVALASCKSLTAFGYVYVYSSVVELCTIVAAFVRVGLEGQVLLRNWISIVYTCCRSGSAILLQGMTVGFALAAAHHFRKAANTAPATRDRKHIGKHVEKAAIYLCPLFNSLGMTMMFAALLELMQSAILYPETSAVVAVALLLVAAFWVLGYPAFRRWYRRSGWASAGSSKGLHIRGLLVATREERKRIPPFIRFWLRQVIGRPDLQKDGDIGESGAAAFPWGGIEERVPGARLLSGPSTEIKVTQSYRAVRFSQTQLHLLRILPQAMWQCSALVAMRIFTSALLLFTELITKRQPLPIIRAFVDVCRYLVMFCFIVAGAYLYEAAVHDRNCSDIQNLIRAFNSLSGMFRRLSFMFGLTATIELITLVVGVVRSGFSV